MFLEPVIITLTFPFYSVLALKWSNNNKAREIENYGYHYDVNMVYDDKPLFEAYP
jgi:hypothetical protein